MKYCRSCSTEYLDTVDRCADCDEVLIEETQWRAMLAREQEKREELRDVEMTPACSVAGRVEAGTLTSALEQEGIAVLLRSYEETAFDGLFIGSAGWGQLWVATSRLDEARGIIASIRQSPSPALPDEE